MIKIHKKIQHHAQRIGQHFAKHHRKYIYASMGYLLSHLFFVKIFLFKVVVLKVVLAILAVLDIYNRHPTFAAVESICINNEKLIPLSTCKINFTNLRDAITYLENKVKIPQSTIYQSIDYQMLKDTLNHYCPEYVSKDIDKRIKEIITQNIAGLPAQKMKKLEALGRIFERYKMHVRQMGTSPIDEGNFCQQKYIDYAMTDEARNEFASILKGSELDKSQNAVYESINRKNDTILGPMLDEQIIRTRVQATDENRLSINDTRIYETYYTPGTYSREISDKIVQLSDNVITASIQRLKDKQILSSSDIASIKNKITVKYTPDCKKTLGLSVFNKKIGPKNKVVGADIQSIILNINICFNYEYIDHLTAYIQGITIHEIGHYIYYTKDQDTKSFEDICRKNNKMTCPKSEFVSEYAKAGPMEDYAESFLHRYLGETAIYDIYTGYYYSGNYFSGGYMSQIKKPLTAKFNHFTSLF